MVERTHFGRYEVIRELGRGGMAVVYLAEDPRVRRRVAIKVLAPHLLLDRLFTRRFEREASAIAALEHSAIIPLYDHGEQDGLPYLVFRYLEGGSLQDLLVRQGPLSIEATIAIAERIGSALDYAHLRGIVHRDVKPANILFDQHGDP